MGGIIVGDGVGSGVGWGPVVVIVIVCDIAAYWEGGSDEARVLCTQLICSGMAEQSPGRKREIDHTSCTYLVLV